MAYYGAIENPVYAPAMRNILSITQAEQAVITTTFDGVVAGDHGYVSGTIVRIIVPINFGMQQINKLSGPITVLSPSTFSIPINTLGFDAFSIPPLNPGHNGTPAQVVPFAEVNRQLSASFRNILRPQ